MYIHADLPDPPAIIGLVPLEDDIRAISLSWTAPVITSPNNDIDEYVMESSINGGDFQLVSIGALNLYEVSNKLAIW